MKAFTFFGAAVASFVAMVSAQAEIPTGTQFQGTNAVLTPDVANPVTAGKPFTITWEGTGLTGSVSLQLLKGPGENIIFQGYIAQSIANTGSYTWDVPADLEASATSSAGYGIRLVEDATQNYQYSTQFGVLAGEKKKEEKSSAASSAAPAPTSAPANVKPQGGKIVYSTSYETVTSCSCTKTGSASIPKPTGHTDKPSYVHPGKPHGTGAAAPSGTLVPQHPNNGTVSKPSYTKPVPVSSQTPLPSSYTGAGAKLQVGAGAFVAAFVGLVALF